MEKRFLILCELNWLKISLKNVALRIAENKINFV